MTHAKNRQAGFTLLEVLLVVTMIGMLSAFSYPVYNNLFIKNDYNIATTTVVQSLRRAQMLSQSTDGDLPWGVYLQSGSVTIFQGTSYVGVRDKSRDEVFSVSTAISFADGDTEVVFNEFTGDLPAAKTIRLKITSTGEFRDVMVNGKGMVSY
jgi:prepilin-type N-terminal cleavage/methylation domain-containing protein